MENINTYLIVERVREESGKKWKGIKKEETMNKETKEDKQNTL